MLPVEGQVPRRSLQGGDGRGALVRPRLRLPVRTPRSARARAPRPAATQGRTLPRREPVLVPRGGSGPGPGAGRLGAPRARLAHGGCLGMMSS